MVTVDQWLVSFRIRCAYHHLLTCWRESDRIKLLDSLLQSQTMHGLQVLGLFDVVTKLFYVEAGRLHSFTGPLLTMSDRGRQLDVSPLSPVGVLGWAHPRRLLGLLVGESGHSADLDTRLGDAGVDCLQQVRRW